MKRWLPFLAAVWMGWPAAGLKAVEVGLIQIEGAITPATAAYVSRALDEADERGYACLIIRLDTPGGLLDSTEKIKMKFYASNVPSVVYVSPSGASATSAGCFITMAADVAAMAPHTSIGAAHPVGIGMGGAEKADDVMKQKTENYAMGIIEAIAMKRGRNAEWAKGAVRDSLAITAEKALATNVIDLIAEDIPDLLKQLDGREVHGKTLKTAGASVVEIPMSLGEKVLQLLGHPEMLMVLMLIAMYGIIGELSNPGAVLPGVVGAIALLLALYVVAVLPVNIAGLALIGLAIVLFIIDIYAPTHGVLTVGGIVSFFLGALMLFNRDPAFRLSLSYIIPSTVITALFFIFVVGKGLSAQRLPAKTGLGILVGRIAPVLARVDSQGGRVFIEGEYWSAVSDTPIEPGGQAEVVGVDGLTLKVKAKA
jgi:membrane-bound serine protease (ClpP class)